MLGNGLQRARDLVIFLRLEVFLVVCSKIFEGVPSFKSDQEVFLSRGYKLEKFESSNMPGTI